MQKLRADSTFLLIWFTLLAFGLLMVLSTSSVLSLSITDNQSVNSIFKQQLFSVFIGLFLALVIAKVDYNRWRPYIIWFNVATIVLLCLVAFTPLGISANGATRWINIGFQFQPSELAKVVIIITLAAIIDEGRKYNELNSLKVLTKIASYLMLYGALIGIPQNHASVVMIIMLTAGTMLFLGGINKLLFLGSFAGLGAIGALVVLTSDFRRNRVLNFLDPLQDKMGDGYQITQNWYALGSGDLFGIGLGFGRQKFGWLPEDHTDFILGIVGEELGYVGILLIIFLFLSLILRASFISLKAEDDFGMLLTSGFISIISVQVLINMAVISGLFPVTGVPLPFISYGGSSTIMMCALAGVVLSVNSKRDFESKD